MTSSKLHPGSQDDELDRALGLLGLSRAEFAEARVRTQHDVDECTELDPPGARGQVRHMRSVRYLREALIPSGWTADDSGNTGAIVSPDGTISIVVASGDASVGRLGQSPRTKYPKGEVTHRRVRQNVQLSLFEDPSGTSPESDSEQSHRQTWVLLQYPDGDHVRAELSCPRGIDESGRISEWSERIILPDLPLDTHETWVPGPDDEGFDLVDVPVSPR